MNFSDWLGENFRKTRMVFAHREQFEADMEEEMRLHRDLRAREIQDDNANVLDDARSAAQKRFGNPLQLREEIHSAWGWTWIDTLRQDLRYGCRLLRKSPGFTLVVITTLGLGIGANTAMFSVVNSVLLRPLPYPKPEQLVSVFEANARQGVKSNGCSYPDLKEIRESGIFAAVAGVQRHDLTLTGVGDPTVVATVVVTPEAFSLLNVSPIAGRYLLPGDETKGAAPVVVLSEGLWRSRFGADPKLIGQGIRLDQQSFTVVGIMPAGFRVPSFGPQQEIWIPIAQDPLFGSWIPRRGGHWLRVLARLKPGETPANVQPQLDAIGRRLQAEFPDQNGGWDVRSAPLQTVVVGEIRTPLLVLLGAVALVLLLACVNVANLLLARATFRAREVALRQAFGAARGRIIRQFLTESALLALMGATLGVALAWFSTHALASLLPADAPASRPVEVDGWVLAFALLISVAAMIAFGLAPALLTSKSDVQSNLREGSAQSGSDRGRLRLRTFLTGAEIALAMVLVVGAALLVQSLRRMTAIDPGFTVAHVTKAMVSLPRYEYKTPQQWATFSDALLRRLQGQPGMKDSAIAVPLPLADGFVNLGFTIAGDAPLPPGVLQSADYASVTPGYFGLMGIPLVRGRVFTADDSMSSPRVAVISESLARRYFGNDNPLGRKLVFGFPPDSDQTREIVGVVGDVRDAGLTQEPGPMMYVPFAQAPFWGGEVVVKSTLPPSTVVAAIRQSVASIDKDLPVTDVETMPGVLEASTAQPRFRTWLLTAFGIVALLLAAAGVYGVVSYSVASRTKEFGVRASLGATPRALGKMVLAEGLALAAAGLGAGLAAALGLARFLKSQLYAVGAYDPITFIISMAVLLGVAIVACYLPARRAMKVDPMVALRCE
jgi:putative ABC transport system permease protein